MAWNGSGTFVRSYDWTDRRDAGNPTNIIDADTMDAEFENYKGGLENCQTRDGQNSPSADLPMGTYKHTGVGDASSRTDYLPHGQAQDGFHHYVSTVGGTADAITLTASPAISSYTAGLTLSFIASGANTTAVTVNVNAKGAKSITKFGSTALEAGDIASGSLVRIQYDGTRFQLQSVSGTLYQAKDSELTALAGLTSAADKLPYFTGSGTADVADLTSAARDLLDDASAGDMRTTLGLGTIATQASDSVSLTGGSISGTNLDGTVNGDGSAVDEPGFRGAPGNTQDTNYTLVLSDAGKTILHTSGSAHAWTIPPNSSVAFPTGTVVVMLNSGSGAVTITRGSGVALRAAGDSTDENKTLSQHGVATLIKAATDSWYVSGV